MNDLRTQKQRLQDAIRERLDRLSPQERAAESRSVCRRIIADLPPPCVVAAFFPISNEVDIRPLLAHLLTNGYTLHLPAFENALVFRRVTDLSTLTPGPLRVPEPPDDADRIDPAAVQLAIIPGRAFDRLGNRLGRGNGGYDRWIRAQRAANPATNYWGVCYDCQVVSSVPMEAHDEPVDAVITPRGRIGA